MSLSVLLFGFIFQVSNRSVQKDPEVRDGAIIGSGNYGEGLTIKIEALLQQPFILTLPMILIGSMAMTYISNLARRFS
jgi:hypothetical protein